MTAAAILFLRMRPKSDRHALVDIYLLCILGEFMFINKGDMKPFAKQDEQTHGHMDGGHFIIACTVLGLSACGR